jgi:hypothetical protein
MLVGISVAGVALVGMLMATMSYMKIWKEVSGSEQNKRFNQEIITGKFLSNELSALFMGLSKLSGNQNLTFRNLSGRQAILDESNVHLYWESTNSLPFVEQDNGGITQCWLVFNEREKELRLYYRSLAPGVAPDYSGSKGEVAQHLVLMKNFKGINLGYTSALSSNIQYFKAPLFYNGQDPDLPEILQFVLDDNPVT